MTGTIPWSGALTRQRGNGDQAKSSFWSALFIATDATGSASFCRVSLLSVSASCHVGCSVSMIGNLIISSLFNTDAETWCRTLLSSAGVAVNSTTQLALTRCGTP